MVLKNNFIAVVKSGGRILREHNGEVRLPFGSEYSVLLKNKDSRKAVASISIDGQSVTEGRIIVDGFSEVELLGFLKGTRVRNKFKFIQKTDEIVEHRGDKVDDGIVTVEYWFEKVVVEQTITKTYWELQPYFYPTYPDRRRKWNDGEYWCSSGTTSALLETTTDTVRDMGVVNCVYTANVTQDEGITVKGSETNQNFNYGNTKTLEEQSNVINIVLKGYKNSGIKVDKPVTTSQKVQCPTCGRNVKSSVKYCSNCGTYLM